MTKIIINLIVKQLINPVRDWILVKKCFRQQKRAVRYAIFQKIRFIFRPYGTIGRFEIILSTNILFLTEHKIIDTQNFM